MAVIRLRDRCANCEAEELFSRIAEDAGFCRFCQSSFCDGDISLLRADVIYRLLICSLRHISVAGIHLRVLPEPLFRGLAAAVPWRKELPSAASSHLGLFPAQPDDLHIDPRIDHGEEVAP